MSLSGLVVCPSDRVVVAILFRLFKLVQKQSVHWESCTNWGLFPAQRTIEDILGIIFCFLNELVNAGFAVVMAAVG